MTARTSLFARPDTFLGVCEAVGEDLSFHANWLRLAVALPLLWAPLWSAIAYGTLAAVVLASRLLFPVRRAAAAPSVPAPAAPLVPPATNDAAEALPLAA